MRECTSTSDSSRRGGRGSRLAALGALALLLQTHSALANDRASSDRSQQPEEEDYTSTPFTEYGEFNEETQEAEDMKFYQSARLFAVQLGLGMSGATGNRGRLWEGGFPMIDFRTVYWFTFNFALDLDLTSMKHGYSVPELGGHTDVSLLVLGANLRYYLDTRDASAPIAFANPFLQLGIGSYTLTQTTPSENTTDRDTSFGISAGAGLEFAIKPKSTYLSVDARIHSVTFNDTHSTSYNVAGAGYLPDLTGLFYTFGANLMFTW